MRSSSTRPSSSHGRRAVVGREREQILLREALDEALAGHGSLVLVSGEAGIGKTTLVEWLAAGAVDVGCLVLQGGCYDLTTTPPYGPWLEALREIHAVDQLPSLPAFVTEADATLRSQQELFAQLTEFFTQVARVRPLVVVLDDLHWADQASLEFLRVWARSIRRQKILVLGSYRGEEVVRNERLNQMVPLLVREAQAERIGLVPLDRQAINALITARYALEDIDSERLLAWLMERAEGNPFFVHELMRTLEEQQVLLPSERGVWQIADLSHIRVPTLIRQVIEGRLNRLSERVRELLQVGAVLGPTVPLRLWQQVTNATDSELIDAIMHGRASDILEETVESHHWRFTHALIRESIYELVAPPQRWIWHQHTAEALTSLPNPNPDIVASHFQQAGDSRAIEWHVRAGLRARRTAWISAAEHFEVAADLMSSDTSRARKRGWLLFGAGFMLRFAGVPRAIQYLEAAEQLARVDNDPVLAAYAGYARGSQMCMNGNIRQGIPEIRHGVMEIDSLLHTHAVPATEERAVAAIQQLLPDDGADQGSVNDEQARDVSRVPAVNQQRGILVNWLAHSGNYREAIAVGTAYIEEMVAAFEDAHLQRPQCVAGHLGLGNANAGLGRPADAQKEYRLARNGFRSVGDYAMAEHAIDLELLMVHIPYRADRLTEREQLRREATELWERCFGLTISTLGDGAPAELQLDVLEGHWQAARRLATDHLTAPWVNQVHEAIATLAVLDRHQGAPDRAWDRVYQLLPEKASTEPGGCYFPFGMRSIALAAELALDAGNPQDAQRWIELHDQWLAWSGGARWHTTNQLLRARQADISGNPSQARQHAEHALALATDPRQPLALIAIHRFLGQLDADASRFEDADTHLASSLRLAQACSAPFERALTQLDLAKLRLAQQRFDETIALLDDVEAVCEPLGAKPTLGRVNTLRLQLNALGQSRPPYPAGLTQREVEVLRHIAIGESNRQIADALFLSPRTVERHVANIYLKIEVHSKAEATAFVLRNHLT